MTARKYGLPVTIQFLRIHPGFAGRRMHTLIRKRCEGGKSDFFGRRQFMMFPSRRIGERPSFETPWQMRATKTPQLTA